MTGPAGHLRRAIHRGDRRTGRHRAGLGGPGIRARNLHLGVEQQPDRLLLDALHHGLEHVVALPLVLDQRVALPHCPQADSLLQVVHFVQVLTPFPVKDGEDDPAFQFPYERVAVRARAEGVLTPVVGVVRVGLQLLDQGFGGQTLTIVRCRNLHADLVQLTQTGPEGVEVPLLGISLRGRAANVRFHRVVDEMADLFVQIGPFENLPALLVDDGALLVHHLVVFQDVLADLEVLTLDLGLRGTDGTGDDLRFDRHVLGNVEPVHDALDGRGVEQPHEVVAQRQVEPGFPAVALATGSSAQLVVDATGLVAFGAQDVEPAECQDLLVLGADRRASLLQRLRPGRFVVLRGVDRAQAALTQFYLGEELGVAAEHDVGTAPGHVGGDGHRAPAPRLGDDRGFPLVLLGVEHLVLHTTLGQLLGQVFRLRHTGRADKHRLAPVVALGDVVDDRTELGDLGLVHDVGLVGPDHRFVRGDRHNAQGVDLVELRRLRHRSSGHPGQFVVEPEVVLQRDRGQGLVLLLDLDLFLGLDRLVHTLAVTPAVQYPTGELVDDENLAVRDDVVLVPTVEFFCLQSVVEIADQRCVHRFVEVVDTELVLHLGHPALGDGHRPLALFHLVVDVSDQSRGNTGELGVPAGRIVRRPTDDQWRPGLVDQNRVDLVDYGEVVPALYEFLTAPGHVVPQVVEAELVVGAVGDVGLVLLAADRRWHLRVDHTDREPEKAVHPAHVLRVPLGQIVVDGDNVHALTGQRVQIGRQRGDEGLALTGLHLGDVAQVQGRPAHDLDIEVPLAEGPPGRFTHGRECFGEKFVEGFPVVDPLPELVGHRAQLGVGEPHEVVLEEVHLLGDGLELAQNTALAGTEDLLEYHG